MEDKYWSLSGILNNSCFPLLHSEPVEIDNRMRQMETKTGISENMWQQWTSWFLELSKCSHILTLNKKQVWDPDH